MARFLATEDGQTVMAVLEWKYEGKVLGATPEQSHTAAAQREVVRFLRRLAQRRE